MGSLPEAAAKEFQLIGLRVPLYSLESEAGGSLVVGFLDETG